MSNTVRTILSFLIPPLAVHDKGADKVIITTLLWLTTGFAGTIAALYFVYGGHEYDRWVVNTFGGSSYDDTYDRYDAYEKAKRAPRYRDDRDYIELADGDVLEVVDTDDEERRRRLER